jgi:hypothetical protein
MNEKAKAAAPKLDRAKAGLINAELLKLRLGTPF